MAAPVLRTGTTLTDGINSIDPGDGSVYEGCIVLVPIDVPPAKQALYNSYYVAWIYISYNAGATQVTLPVVPTGLGPMYIVDLPDGFDTSPDAIAAVIPAGGSNGPPTGVDGT